MHLIASSTTWYAARAGGIVAYVLITTAVLVGVGLAGKVRVPWLPRFAVEDIHRFLGLLAGTFVTIHVVGIALDTSVNFSVSQLVIPFTASFRPLWTGLGVVAMETLVALAITNRLRSRLSQRLWRRLHYASFVVWVAATAHGFMSGTDRDQIWLIAVYAVSVGAVAAAVALRVEQSPPRADSGSGATRVPLPARSGWQSTADDRLSAVERQDLERGVRHTTR